MLFGQVDVQNSRNNYFQSKDSPGFRNQRIFSMNEDKSIKINRPNKIYNTMWEIQMEIDIVFFIPQIGQKR